MFENFSFLEKGGATKIAVFGSYARRRRKPKSDTDIIQLSFT
ncbi:nucleotidyltransferase domain-containing protein [Methanosarcina barkeri]|uniref:Nucleotidyltransferase n=1 Tax=Methanosarcina barkeri (strain Fusaro / DSM 804) TaxID=269797 RepID=Q46BX2_METBF|nr:nucleotidyltransferase domain-containing protein [Methanosarcina barkeri]